MKTCDVIIPTHNSAQVITGTINALSSQKISKGWQLNIIISDDGSVDQTVATISELNSRWPILTLCGEHRGAGIARNRALDKARGDVLLLLGADIRLMPGAIDTHLKFHENHQNKAVAALGFVFWDPTLSPSPIMEWMIHGGPQNDYDSLLAVSTCDPAHYWYGSHVSIRREVLGDDRFSEVFKGYGWEDLELGRRLGERSIALNVLVKARGLHHHYYSLNEIVSRQFMSGFNLKNYQSLYPSKELLPKLTIMHKCKLFLLALGGEKILHWLVIHYGMNQARPNLYQLLCTSAFLRGVWASKRLN
jgi:glycosyltransferase involved in cell wall biosynthesis